MVISKCELDFSKWNPNETNLSLHSYVVLSLLSNNLGHILEAQKEEFDLDNILTDLQVQGYVKIIEDGVELRQKTLDLFKITNVNASDWIDEWRKIFPAGSNTGGFRYRGDKQGCLKKMNKFLKDHRAVSKEEIIIATKKYVERYKLKNFTYMKQAHFFIEKEGLSTLASEIESINENEYESTGTRRRTRLLE